jgi:WD40 repeat protein
MLKINKIDTFAGHRDCVYSIVSVEEKVFSAGGDGMVIEWDLKKPDLGKVFAKTQNSVYKIELDSTENQLIIAENFEGLHFIDLDTKLVIKTLKLSNSYFFDIKIHKELIFVASGDGLITIINKNENAIKKHLKVSSKSIRNLAINGTKNELIAVSSDFSFSVFDLNTFVIKNHHIAHQNSIFSIAFSPDNRYFITGSRDAHLKVWNAESYELKLDIPAHLFAINAISFNPYFQIFATCSMDKTIKIWDAENLKLLKVLDKSRFAGHGTSINCLNWVNKNTLLAGSDDKMISVWNIEL